MRNRLVATTLSALLVGRIGIAGAGIAYVVTFALASAAMAAVVFGKGSALRPRAVDLKLEPRDGVVLTHSGTSHQ